MTPVQRPLIHFCHTPGCTEPAALIDGLLPMLHCEWHNAIYEKEARAWR